jgi:hypothetical protein
VLELLRDRKFSLLYTENFAVTSDAGLRGRELAEDRLQLAAAMRQLFSTNVGRRTLIAAAHKGEKISVVLNRSNVNQASGLGTFSFQVDVRSPSNIQRLYNGTERNSVPFTLATVIAHEIGHAVFGYRDNVVSIDTARRVKSLRGHLNQAEISALQSPGDVVTHVENTFRREVGLPARPSYNFPFLLRRYFPESFK